VKQKTIYGYIVKKTTSTHLYMYPIAQIYHNS